MAGTLPPAVGTELPTPRRAARGAEDQVTRTRRSPMKRAATLQLTTPSDREIVMTRVFDAPRKLVFDAHTKPELVKRWLLVARGARRSPQVGDGEGRGGKLRQACRAVGVNQEVTQSPVSSPIERGHMQKIVPFLWFDGTAEEAMNFYVSIFKNSKVLNVTRYGAAGPGPKGTVMWATFQLEGQQFYALNGGPQFKFTPAISLFVNCETQQEVDELWKKLSAGGREDQCGWLQDKYGLSWQIVPTVLGKMLGDKDPAKADRAMRAMLQMKKIDIQGLQQAYDRG